MNFVNLLSGFESDLNGLCLMTAVINWEPRSFAGQFRFSYLFSPLFSFLPLWNLVPSGHILYVSIILFPLGKLVNHNSRQGRQDKRSDLMRFNVVCWRHMPKTALPIHFIWLIYSVCETGNATPPITAAFFLFILFHFFSLSWYPLVQGFNLHC